MNPGSLQSVCRFKFLAAFVALMAVAILAYSYMGKESHPKVDFSNIAIPPGPRPVTPGAIPKIIHQTFTTRRIFTEYRKHIEHCLKLNPDWEYYLWTDKDIVAFINDHYPFFMRKFLIFKMHVQRGDSIRYMVLHHYGGIYIDMDVECVKPFFPSLENLTAFVDQEAKEHAVILYGKDFSAMNSAMGSVPGHPFFLRLVFAMMEVDDKTGGAGPTTGPDLLTSQLQSWWTDNATSRHVVTLLDPPVFSPLIDDGLHHFRSKCRTLESFRSRPTPAAKRLHDRRLQLCRRYAERNWKHDLTGPETVGRHLFLHLGYRWSKRRPNYFDIAEKSMKAIKQMFRHAHQAEPRPRPRQGRQAARAVQSATKVTKPAPIFEDIDRIAAEDAGAPPVQYAKISDEKHRLIIGAIDRGDNNRSIANLARRQEFEQTASLGARRPYLQHPRWCDGEHVGVVVAAASLRQLLVVEHGEGDPIGGRVGLPDRQLQVGGQAQPDKVQRLGRSRPDAGEQLAGQAVQQLQLVVQQLGPVGRQELGSGAQVQQAAELQADVTAIAEIGADHPAEPQHRRLVRFTGPAEPLRRRHPAGDGQRKAAGSAVQQGGAHGQLGARRAARGGHLVVADGQRQGGAEARQEVVGPVEHGGLLIGADVPQLVGADVHAGDSEADGVQHGYAEGGGPGGGPHRHHALPLRVQQVEAVDATGADGGSWEQRRRGQPVSVDVKQLAGGVPVAAGLLVALARQLQLQAVQLVKELRLRLLRWLLLLLAVEPADQVRVAANQQRRRLVALSDGHVIKFSGAAKRPVLGQVHRTNPLGHARLPQVDDVRGLVGDANEAIRRAARLGDHARAAFAVLKGRQEGLRRLIAVSGFIANKAAQVEHFGHDEHPVFMTGRLVREVAHDEVVRTGRLAGQEGLGAAQAEHPQQGAVLRGPRHEQRPPRRGQQQPAVLAKLRLDAVAEVSDAVAIVGHVIGNPKPDGAPLGDVPDEAAGAKIGGEPGQAVPVWRAEILRVANSPAGWRGCAYLLRVDDSQLAAAVQIVSGSELGHGQSQAAAPAFGQVDKPQVGVDQQGGHPPVDRLAFLLAAVVGVEGDRQQAAAGVKILRSDAALELALAFDQRHEGRLGDGVQPPDRGARSVGLVRGAEQVSLCDGLDAVAAEAQVFVEHRRAAARRSAQLPELLLKSLAHFPEQRLRQTFELKSLRYCFQRMTGLLTCKSYQVTSLLTREKQSRRPPGMAIPMAKPRSKLACSGPEPESKHCVRGSRQQRPRARRETRQSRSRAARRGRSGRTKPSRRPRRSTARLVGSQARLWAAMRTALYTSCASASMPAPQQCSGSSRSSSRRSASARCHGSSLSRRRFHCSSGCGRDCWPADSQRRTVHPPGEVGVAQEVGLGGLLELPVVPVQHPGAVGLPVGQVRPDRLAQLRPPDRRETESASSRVGVNHLSQDLVIKAEQVFKLRLGETIAGRRDRVRPVKRAPGGGPAGQQGGEDRQRAAGQSGVHRCPLLLCEAAAALAEQRAEDLATQRHPGRLHGHLAGSGNRDRQAARMPARWSGRADSTMRTPGGRGVRSQPRWKAPSEPSSWSRLSRNSSTRRRCPRRSSSELKAVTSSLKLCGGGAAGWPAASSWASRSASWTVRERKVRRMPLDSGLVPRKRSSTSGGCGGSRVAVPATASASRSGSSGTASSSAAQATAEAAARAITEVLPLPDAGLAVISGAGQVAPDGGQLGLPAAEVRQISGAGGRVLQHLSQQRVGRGNLRLMAEAAVDQLGDGVDSRVSVSRLSGDEAQSGDQPANCRTSISMSSRPVGSSTAATGAARCCRWRLAATLRSAADSRFSKSSHCRLGSWAAPFHLTVGAKTLQGTPELLQGGGRAAPKGAAELLKRGGRAARRGGRAAPKGAAELLQGGGRAAPRGRQSCSKGAAELLEGVAELLQGVAELLQGVACTSASQSGGSLPGPWLLSCQRQLQPAHLHLLSRLQQPLRRLHAVVIAPLSSQPAAASDSAAKAALVRTNSASEMVEGSEAVDRGGPGLPAATIDVVIVDADGEEVDAVAISAVLAQAGQRPAGQVRAERRSAGSAGRSRVAQAADQDTDHQAADGRQAAHSAAQQLPALALGRSRSGRGASGSIFNRCRHYCADSGFNSHSRQCTT
uniref:Glycosyltransferase family 32 protein n=1 Tax=Macrostomum lignano TaxID=282301 RepID=A0A1I8HPF5_9PLAT